MDMKKRKQLVFGVAPHAGAWIEISGVDHKVLINGVAPHAGAWIEITLTVDRQL